MEQVSHPIPPIFDEHSKILILGSFPSVKSREGCFFYHHPQNRFWKVLAQVLDQPVPETIEEKKHFLAKNHIAVWDVIASCTIEGSSDSSIKNVVPTDLEPILSGSQIKQIFCNGGTSHQYYRKYQEPSTGRTAIRLPSTSPANAAWSLERLKKEWSVILDDLKSE
ncbi:MAG: DNA-deoxyinosine glycosylase [Lachnospiraceae bacterium]|nr:DNA-deoxyinosine glycosylase [Lachnospiraceae bacterium]